VTVALRSPLLQARDVSKHFDAVTALEHVSLDVYPGEVLCLLGDNGAGKSTLIKILSGLYRPDEGEVLIDGKPVALSSPRDALARGIATVYQDLSVLPLMSVTRNFIVGTEPTRSRWLPLALRRIDFAAGEAAARAALADIGIQVADMNTEVAGLSGGQRQSLAIARAEHVGARVLILDEPTSALGVNEAAVVLRHVLRARARGRAIILITHNPQHALPVGDRFVVLNHGRASDPMLKKDVQLVSLLQMMGGGAELESLGEELEALATTSGFNDMHSLSHALSGAAASEAADHPPDPSGPDLGTSR
jgi:simple sugar transport system ATP-binding protein